MVLRSASRSPLATSALCCELARSVAAKSVNQYLRSPKCLLALLALRTIETSRASSDSACESRASSRVSSAATATKIASSRTARKIRRARIEKCDMFSWCESCSVAEGRSCVLLCDSRCSTYKSIQRGRASPLAAQQIGIHLLICFKLDGAAPLKDKMLGEAHKGGLRHLDLIRNAARFHGAGGVNGIAPDIIGKFVHADDPRHDIAAMKTDPDL